VLGDTVMVGPAIDPAIMSFYDSYYSKLRSGLAPVGGSGGH